MIMVTDNGTFHHFLGRDRAQQENSDRNGTGGSKS